MTGAPTSFRMRLLREERLRPLIGTDRAGLYPRRDEVACLLLRSRRGLPADAWRPCPAYESVAADMMNECLEHQAAIALRILDLSTNLTQGLAFPSHFQRRQMPMRMTRNTTGI